MDRLRGLPRVRMSVEVLWAASAPVVDDERERRKKEKKILNYAFQ